MNKILVRKHEDFIGSFPPKAWLWFMNNWRDVLVWTWTVVVLSADLKVSIYSHIHWVATILLLIPVFLVVRRHHTNLNRIKFVIIPSLLLVCAVVISSFNSANLFYGLVQSGKLIAILILAYSFFIIWPKYACVAYKGFIAAAFLNGILIILGILLFSGAAYEMALGRWGTFLNYPGSLVKTGMLVFTYAAYVAITSKPFSFKNILLFCFSFMIIYFDGSRTGFIALLVAVFFVLIIRFLECRTWQWQSIKFTLYRLACVLVSLAIFWSTVSMSLQLFNYIQSPIIIGLTKNLNQHESSTVFKEKVIQQHPQGFARINKRVEDTSKYNMLYKIAASDPTRFKMLQDGVAAVKLHPVFGTGIGSTKLETRHGTMVIHNTYLQVWADLGLLGLIAYVVLVLGWILFLPNIYRRIRKLTDVKKRAVYYNAVFLLGYFAFNGLFHPLSTEWSEWITFIIPCALLYEVVTSTTVRKQEV